MTNIFRNLDREKVGIFFISEDLEQFFYVRLKLEKDRWQISKFDQADNLESLELNDLPICVCMDSSEFKQFRATFPPMPPEDLQNVVTNEIMFRYGFKSRNDFCFAVKKISNEHEVLFIESEKIDRIVEKFSNLQLKSVTIFDSTINFPIAIPTEINDQAIFAANSIAFSDVETINLLPYNKRKTASRWNFKNLTLAVWILSAAIFAGFFFYAENLTASARENLQMLELELEKLPVENPDEAILLERESNLIELLKSNSDNISEEYLQRLSSIKIENVFVQSFEHSDEKISIRVIGSNPESLTEFFAKLRNLPGDFKQKIYFDKSRDKSQNWILEIESKLK